MMSTDIITLLDKYMYMTRDFNSAFIKKSIPECYYFFVVCRNSQKTVQKLFGISELYFILCIDEKEDFKRAYYILNNKAKVKAKDIKMVEFTALEAKKVKEICNYKKLFNGRGEDPKCST